ncbi:hypothetical protein DL770_009752 [Monosporascus sp. CRB-9-2]|nr:hypothetical protein DL770_009752 [Monosporascus sp. CRB-9-2]
MSVLAVPNTGLQLESSAKSSNFLPLQAFGITLNDNVIEDMIKCVQNGDQIELSLGNNPSFHYGSKVQKIEPDSFEYDLYLTNLDDSATKAQRLPNPTMSLFKKPTGTTGKPAKSQTERATKGGKLPGRAPSPGPESDKNTSGTKLVNGIPKDTKQKGKGGKAGGLLPAGKSMATALSSNTTRSLPPSPSLNSAKSPNPVISASQQLLEKNKEQRSILVHELAARDQAYEHLQDCWMGADSDLKPTLEKVATYDESSKKWSLKKLFWKELDVWNYNYDSAEDRQAAIDNAIKQYDKQRIGTTSPEWERLLPPEERGQGKTLSKLQATLANRNITHVQKTEDGGKSDTDTSKLKSVPMSRSGSQSGASKTKKSTDQAKRLLSTNPKKPAAPKKPIGKAKVADEKDKRGPLSEEFVVDSGSSGDEAPPPNPAPAAKPRPVEKPNKRPVEQVAEKAAERRKESPAPVSAPKPKPVVRAPRAPLKAPISASTKRAREDDDSSSSSGTPLSKRLKPKEIQKPRPNITTTKHRMSDVSQTSRSTVTATQSSSLSIKSKNTSPAKSSPLASSPPTNASDLEEHSQGQTQSQKKQQQQQQQQRNGDRSNGLTNGNSMLSIKKRKERETEPPVSNKRPRVSKEVLKRASLFTRYYERYEALHKEIVTLKEPPEDKLTDLLDMRERLVTMKSEIAREVAASA